MAMRDFGALRSPLPLPTLQPLVRSSAKKLLIKHSKKQGWPGSVRFGYGLWVERFKRFWFSVPAAPLQKCFFCVSVQFNRKGRFRFRFRFLENGSGGSGFHFRFREKRFQRFRFPVLVRFLSHPEKESTTLKIHWAFHRRCRKPHPPFRRISPNFPLWGSFFCPDKISEVVAALEKMH